MSVAESAALIMVLYGSMELAMAGLQVLISSD
jgi:hypothetical protein